MDKPTFADRCMFGDLVVGTRFVLSHRYDLEPHEPQHCIKIANQYYLIKGQMRNAIDIDTGELLNVSDGLCVTIDDPPCGAEFWIWHRESSLIRTRERTIKWIVK